MSNLGLAKMTELPEPYINQTHYQHSLEFLINNTIGRPLLCYTCAHESLKNAKELSSRKQMFLGLIKSLLDRRDNELFEKFCSIENKKLGEEFIDTLFGELKFIYIT